MVKLTKIYTRQGDTGETHLAGGGREKKSHQRFAAIGAIDELNSWMGHVITEAKSDHEIDTFIQSSLAIQQVLFNLGAEIAIPDTARRDDSPVILEENISLLEQDIDRMNDALPALTSFILPGGNELSSRLHITRSVCRRAERELFILHELEPLRQESFVLAYINRLSDWLFVAARYICRLKNIPETLWV